MLVFIDFMHVFVSMFEPNYVQPFYFTSFNLIRAYSSNSHPHVRFIIMNLLLLEFIEEWMCGLTCRFHYACFLSRLGLYEDLK